eukprot:365303-Chlamydomonas_euryale.AAC.33
MTVPESGFLIASCQASAGLASRFTEVILSGVLHWKAGMTQIIYNLICCTDLRNTDKSTQDTTL